MSSQLWGKTSLLKCWGILLTLTIIIQVSVVLVNGSDGSANASKYISRYSLYLYVVTMRVYNPWVPLLSLIHFLFCYDIWTASSEFGTYRLCEQWRFRRACASAQSRQNLRFSLIQAVSQEEPSDRKPDPWPLWMAGHAQLKFIMTECSKAQIRLTGLIWRMELLIGLILQYT